MQVLHSIRARLNREQAALSEAQINALRQHVLPMLEQMTRGYYYNPTTWVPKYIKNGVKNEGAGLAFEELTTTGKSFIKAMVYLKYVCTLVQAVVGKQTPAKRALELNRALGKASQSWRDPVSMDKILSITMGILRRLSSDFTPEGKEFFAATQSTYFKLLQKSWGYIINECENEYADIIREHNLHFYATDLSKKQMWADMQKLLKGWTFTATPEKKEKFYRAPETFTATSPDGLSKIDLVISYGDQFQDFSLKPYYRMLQDGWYSWGRLGVEDGSKSYKCDEHSLESAIEEVLEQIEKARAARTKLDAEGQTYDFGPVKRKLLPAALADIVKRLKDTGGYSIEPSGFGTAYIFSTKRPYPDSRPASAWLSQQVGTQVYYTTADRD